MPGYCPRHGFFAGKWCSQCISFNKEEIEQENETVIQLYSIPRFVIFNSQDPNLIPNTIEKINEVMREYREFYWNLIEDAGVKLDYETSSKPIHEKVKITEEIKNMFRYCDHLNAHIQQYLSPLFITQFIKTDDYDKYMKVFEKASDFFQHIANEPEGRDFYINFYYETVLELFDAIKLCFKEYLKK